MLQQLFVIAAQNMNAIRHADGHEHDRHYGGDKVHRNTKRGHNTEGPDHRHDNDCQRQEDAAQASIRTI